jgi:hypothetical protein
MINRGEQRERMARYLLGEMSEEERVTFESQYAADRDLFEELVDVENDLVDRYARGRLTEAHRKHFERYYMATPKRRERAELAKSLAHFISGYDAQEKAGASDTRDREHDLLRGSVGMFPLGLPFPRVRIAAVLIVCIAIAAALGFLLIDNLRLHHELADMQAARNNLQTEKGALLFQIAALRQQLQEVPNIAPDTVDLHPPTEIAVLTLAAGQARNGEEENRLVIFRGWTRSVRLQLKLDQRQYTSYAVSLEAADRGIVWRRTGLKRKMTRRQGAIVTAELPANDLKSGDYVVNLSGTAASGIDENVDAYLFRAITR